MHYWNKDNFLGLRNLGDAFRNEGLEPLARYCELREKGLRKGALSELRSFLAEASTYDTNAARQVCRTILELYGQTQGVHQFVSEPLLNQFLLPTLRSWRTDAPSDPLPPKWLGLLKRDEVMLDVALQLAPEDTAVRRRLITFALDDVDYATHHLSETLFLGAVEDAERSLEKAYSLINSAPDPSDYDAYRDEADHLARLLFDWQAYSAKPKGTFPQWCKERGRDYKWPAIVYYDP